MSGFSRTSENKWWTVMFALCVLLILLQYRGEEESKSLYNIMKISPKCGEAKTANNVTPKTDGNNENIIFGGRKMWSCCLNSVLSKNMKCKQHDCVLWLWRRVNLLLLDSSRNCTKISMTSLERDRLESCSVFLEKFGNPVLSISKTTDKGMSWTHMLKNLVMLLAIFVFFGNGFALKNYKESDFVLKGSLRSILTQLSIRPLNITVYPSSLDNYFNHARKGTEESRMQYEWLRYSTFKSFPDTSVASPMRLAADGFYYAGQGEESICFSCGVKNSQWSERESVRQTHKRLSPNCNFINGTDSSNVPIHASQSANTTSEASTTTGGACGGPDNGADASSNIPTDGDLDIKGSDFVSSDIVRDEHVSIRSNNSPDIDRTQSTSTPWSSRGDFSNHVGGNNRFPGIYSQQPKHPEFSIKSQRLSTYEQWPETHPISPEELAESGFFVIGPGDTVRCFFCGGGMRSWRYGDSPWVEHARWYPSCEYVRQFKGDNFVNMCRAAHLENHTDDQMSPPPPPPPNEIQQTNIISDRQIEDLHSTAASMVLDMGYTQQQVEEAIRQHRQAYPDSTELRVQHLLEYLLDNTYTPLPTQTPSTAKSATKANNQTADKLTSKKTDTQSTTAAPNDLAKENEKLKEKMLCKICFDKDANIVFLPCGHMVSCVECAHALRKCAMCRELIQGRIRTYLG